VSIGVSLLVVGVVVPRAGRAQDPGQQMQQQMQQQAQEQADLAQQQAQQAQLIQQQMQQNMDQQQAQMQAASYQNTVVVPEHLQIGNQRFDPSLAGFRAYLDTIKFSDPSLYGQLAPDTARLESQEYNAKTALVGGIVVGLASVIYGFAGGDTCNQPPVTDPHFAADTDAWSNCNQGNVTRATAFGFLGVGAIIAGGVISHAMWPKHQDVVNLVNKNNRLSKQPLQWQVGYDPTQRFAFSGASVSF
jgi:hypothetical protein